MLTESADKESHTCGEQTHLYQGIETDRDNHISGNRKSSLIEKGKYHSVGPGMMIVVGNYTQNLLELIDTVRSHNAGILIEIIRKPAQKTDQE